MKFIFKLVERKEEFAILEDEHGKKIQWPSDKLPNDIDINQKIFFNISDSEFDNQKAKEILNEIFQVDK